LLESNLTGGVNKPGAKQRARDSNIRARLGNTGSMVKSVPAWPLRAVGVVAGCFSAAMHSGQNHLLLPPPLPTGCCAIAALGCVPGGEISMDALWGRSGDLATSLGVILAGWHFWLSKRARLRSLGRMVIPLSASPLHMDVTLSGAKGLITPWRGIVHGCALWGRSEDLALSLGGRLAGWHFWLSKRARLRSPGRMGATLMPHPYTWMSP